MWWQQTASPDEDLASAEASGQTGEPAGEPVGGPGAAGTAPPEGGPPGTLLAVVDGQVQVLPGPPGAERAVIEPGQDVTLWVNGRQVVRPHPVGLGDEVVAEPASRPPVSQAVVRLSEDLLQAWVTVERQPGMRYELVETTPTPSLLVQARPVEALPPPPVGEEEVRAALQRAGVRAGVMDEAIRRVLESPPGEAVLVAQGQPAEPPEDGRIELLFEERSAPRLDLDAERIDLFERGAITWVQPGQVLAVCHPARPGRPGLNVLGEPIPVRQPQPAVLRAGKGVTLSEDGTRAIAAQPGRPQVAGNVISVVPVYEVAQDASSRTGHVRFTGDVHIRGDVLDGVEVEAGGEVRVGGLVSRATIRARGAVRVGRTIVGSRVEAGARDSASQTVLPVLVDLVEGLGSLLEAAYQLRQRLEGNEAGPEAAALALSHLGAVRDGELVKRLLERKFWELPRLARQLGAEARQLQLVPGGPELATEAARMLVGAGPLRLRSLAELARLREGLERVREALLPQQGQEADVTALSVQNSTVEATGWIRLYGAGAFNSTLSAGRGFEAPRGVVRGGQVTVAEGDLTVKELGGASGVVTSAVVLRRGRIAAQLVYPNVAIAIGGQKHVFSDGARVLRARLGPDGRLVVEHLKADFSRRDRPEPSGPAEEPDGPPGQAARSGRP